AGCALDEDDGRALAGSGRRRIVQSSAQLGQRGQTSRVQVDRCDCGLVGAGRDQCAVVIDDGDRAQEVILLERRRGDGRACGEGYWIEAHERIAGDRQKMVATRGERYVLDLGERCDRRGFPAVRPVDVTYERAAVGI